MPVKKAITTRPPKKIATSSPAARPRNDKMSIPVYSLAGRATGTMSLPKEVFGGKINKALLAQALRVYMTNQKTLPGFTKTRGEVVGSTAKIYRQKGTGRARHGAISAPIFVGGGIVFGPKPRKIRLHLSQNMKKQALISALSAKLKDTKILGVSGLEKASGKTREFAFLFKKVESKSALIVTNGKMDNVLRGARNIPGISVLPANQLNAYEVLKYQKLLITKEALEVLGK